jgi:hypothetical protein
MSARNEGRTSGANRLARQAQWPDVIQSTVIIGIPQEKVDELVRDAKRPLEGLTSQQRENIALLKEKLDLNERQVRAALGILGENDIPPERLAAKLVQIAERFILIWWPPPRSKALKDLPFDNLWLRASGFGSDARPLTRTTAGFSGNFEVGGGPPFLEMRAEKGTHSTRIRGRRSHGLTRSWWSRWQWKDFAGFHVSCATWAWLPTSLRNRRSAPHRWAICGSSTKL